MALHHRCTIAGATDRLNHHPDHVHQLTVSRERLKWSVMMVSRVLFAEDSVLGDLAVVFLLCWLCAGPLCE